MRERSESRVVSVDYDGLLRSPTLLDLPVEPQQRRSLGLREVPGNPATAPDLVELQDNFNALQGIVRRFGDARDQDLELLAIKGLLRRERIYREAVLVVLKSAAGQLQVAPVVDGVLNNELERCLASADARRQLRLPPDIRRNKRHDALLPAGLLDQYDADADREARRLRSVAAAHEEPESAEARQAAEAAAFATRALRLRQLAPHEHPRLLWSVLKSAVERIIIATPAITGAVADRELLRTVESAMSRGVDITLIASAADELPAWMPPMAAESQRFSLFEAEISSSTVVRDSSLAFLTTFPILAYYGKERPWRDERGWLLSTPEYVEPLVDRILQKTHRLSTVPLS